MSALRKIIAPIVEGQIRSYLNDHPEIAEAYTGKRRAGLTKREALVNSIAKRITNDLTCGMVTARLEAALLEVAVGEAVKRAGVEDSTAVAADGAGTVRLAPSARLNA